LGIFRTIRTGAESGGRIACFGMPPGARQHMHGLDKLFGVERLRQAAVAFHARGLRLVEGFESTCQQHNRRMG
jgi:hypothetical protein